MPISELDKVIHELDCTSGLIKQGFATSEARPFRNNIAKHSFELISEIDSIYFTGEHPLIYFKQLRQMDPVLIRDLHKKIWNQGRVPLLFVSTLSELRVYNCYAEPLRMDDTNINSLEIDRFNNVLDELERLKSTYHQSKLDSGLFWETVPGKKINSSKKVDQLLVSNLKETRKKLFQLFPKKAKNVLPIIHNLLSRSLFILYLEDRKVITPVYYSEFIQNTNSYFDLLRSRRATYDLYKALNNKFNGDLFTISKDELENITHDHLSLIRDCFYGNIDMRSGQQYLWRQFDFSFIPIELISSIYEEFLHTEEGEVEISNQGAYYTPQPLVEFVLNEVLPLPDKNNTNYNIKIFDPACGSGIFLVEAYRRLIERWKYVHQDARISIDDLRSILQNCIFGVEQNSEAIKVASFSLYLTILNYLQPKYIWTKVIFPDLIQSPEKPDNRQGRNLFHGDTFEINSYEEINFDLIVGNPPWKRGNLSKTLNEYIKVHGLANEAVLPFIHKMAHTAPNAKIALVCAAKILFNSTSGYENFRRFLFTKTNVESIVNFAALRKSRGEIGRKLFSSATGPTIVIFFNGINIKRKKNSIIYCSPKPQLRDSALNELVIDASDIKFIPIEEAVNPKSPIWKIAMWGTYRDLQFLKKMFTFPSIEKYIIDDQSGKWVFGGGFQISDPRNINNTQIRKLPLLPAEAIQKYYTPIESTIKITHTQFRRLGCEPAYKAPHLIIKKGQTKNEFCATFADYDCCFKDVVYAIHSPANEELLKALTVFLNSKFTTYYLFLVSASWGIEREKITANEFLAVPFLDFLKKQQSINWLSTRFDQIKSLICNFSMGQDQAIQKITDSIDQYIFKQLGGKSNDLALFENILNSQLDFFQKGTKSDAIKPIVTENLVAYGEAACKNLENLIPEAKTNFWATTYYHTYKYPLTFISIHFNLKNENGTVLTDETKTAGTILQKINKHIYERYSESVYFRKVVKYYDNDVLFIVKPNEKRFWTKAVALEDSDAIAFDLMEQGGINE